MAEILSHHKNHNMYTLQYEIFQNINCNLYHMMNDICFKTSKYIRIIYIVLELSTLYGVNKAECSVIFM
jgi:hypothetical protein